MPRPIENLDELFEARQSVYAKQRKLDKQHQILDEIEDRLKAEEASKTE